MLAARERLDVYTGEKAMWSVLTNGGVPWRQRPDNGGQAAHAPAYHGHGAASGRTAGAPIPVQLTTLISSYSHGKRARFRKGLT